MNEFIIQRFIKTDNANLEPITHELPTLEYSLEWLKTQGECAQVVLGFITKLEAENKALWNMQ